MLAVVRPDSWNLPLLLHVLGAMLLLGSLLFAAVALIGAWRSRSPGLARSGAQVLLLGAFPSYLLMRLAAQWIYSKEHLDKVKPTPSWINLGFGISDGGAVLIIAALIAAGLSARRIKRGDGLPGTGARVAAVLAAVMVVAYLVAIWAMTTKPI